MITIQNANKSVSVEISIETPIEKLDITSMLEEIDIFEGMFFDGVNCRLRIKDTMNLVETLPILGGEKLNVVFGGNKEKFSFIFRIVEIKDYLLSENRAFAIYSIYGISEQSFQNTQKRLFISFGTEKKKTKGSDIVKKVCKNYLKIKDFQVDETKHERYIVATGWTPHELLQYIAKTDEPITIKGKKPLPFIFFETRDKFFFVNWQSVLDGGLYHEGYEVFLNDPAINEKQTMHDYNMHNAVQWKFDLFNHEKNIQDGIFGSRFIYFDPVKKKYERIDTKHQDVLNSIKIKNYSSPFLIENTHKIIGDSNFYTKLFAFLGNGEYTYFDKIKNKGLDMNDAVVELFENYKITATFDNITNLKVGALAFITVPSPKMRGNEAITTWKTATGYYIVESIRHHIHKTDGYSQVVSFVKGSLNA